VRKKNRSIPAFIYGVDANAISVANALNPSTFFRVLGFVDNNKKIRQN
jgi:hypothetical protein